MIFKGKDAINFLIDKIQDEDPAASSHWKKYHSSFDFTGSGFTGLLGFGGISLPYRGLKLWLHTVLQKRICAFGKEFPEFKSIEIITKDILRKQNRAYNQDVIRQVLTASFLRKNVPNKLSSDKTILVIGDGFASMTSILLANNFAGTIILVNLNKTLLVDLWYLKLWLKELEFEETVSLVTANEDIQELFRKDLKPKQKRIISIQASNHELLKDCPVDLAINIASMQEMNPGIIEEYFSDMRHIAKKNDFTFYCCNREQKTLPDGTITCFENYPWKQEDEIIVNELCPWYQQYYRLIPPFYHQFDGPHRHQLRNFKSKINE